MISTNINCVVHTAIVVAQFHLKGQDDACTMRVSKAIFSSDLINLK